MRAPRLRNLRLDKGEGEVEALEGEGPWEAGCCTGAGAKAGEGAAAANVEDGTAAAKVEDGTAAAKVEEGAAGVLNASVGMGIVKLCSGDDCATTGDATKAGVEEDAGTEFPAYSGDVAGAAAGAASDARYCGDPRMRCTSYSSGVREGPLGLASRMKVSEMLEPGAPKIRSLSSCRERPRTALPSTLTMTSSGEILPQRSALPPGT